MIMLHLILLCASWSHKACRDFQDHWVVAYNDALNEVDKDMYGKSAVDILIHTAQQVFF